MTEPRTAPPLLARFATPVAIVLAVGLAAFAVADQMAAGRRAAGERALIVRADDLTARTLTPGSALSCLDAAAGDATETACEAAIFASPQATAAAVAYIGARLTLLADGKDMPALAARLAAPRRAIELDRFGIAAHVLSQRDGCSAAQCTGFALVNDSSMLRSNLKARTFDQYVSRHAVNWNAPPVPQAPSAPAVSQAPAPPAPGTQAAAVTEPRPVSPKYDFPSAASIPPVSIMNAEPALPKEAAAAQAAAPGDKATPVAPQPDRTPVPPRRPQAANEPADTATPR
jgi:hypothetical protein